MVCDEGRGVGATGLAVYLDFRDAIKRDSKRVIAEKYGNLFDMYHHITNENPYEKPMKIYPAVHYTMGGLWVDYNLMSNIPGLHVLGEANFSDHGANRLGASALMQGLCDGYFVIPFTLGHYLASNNLGKVGTDHPSFAESEAQVKSEIEGLIQRGQKGHRTPLEIYRDLGKVMWNQVGMARNESGLKKAVTEIQGLRNEFSNNLKLTGSSGEFNKNLEIASRLGDFLELGELMASDALHRKESCGGHFREESQTPDCEAKRDDDNFCYVAAWEFKGVDKAAALHKEKLEFENVHLAQRSYK
jgi:succinate dehydrogenase / fumarate reductase flavoprotein subunit